MSDAQLSIAAAVAVRGLAQVAVVVQDVDRARAFYRDRLGLRHLFDAPPSMAFFACGDVRLMLSPAENAEQARLSSLLYLDVPDIERAHRALAAAGVVFVREPHRVARLERSELWLAFFHDSEGNLLALSSEVPIT